MCFKRGARLRRRSSTHGDLVNHALESIILSPDAFNVFDWNLENPRVDLPQLSNFPLLLPCRARFALSNEVNVLLPDGRRGGVETDVRECELVSLCDDKAGR